MPKMGRNEEGGWERARWSSGYRRTLTDESRTSSKKRGTFLKKRGRFLEKRWRFFELSPTFFCGLCVVSSRFMRCFFSFYVLFSSYLCVAFF